MRIGCLQFAPRVGDVDNNINRADAVLEVADPNGLDLLVLPELAFSGYNFKSLSDISPFLEHTQKGISSVWARTIALKYDCTVVVGYPEKVDVSARWPADPEYYNSAVVVSGDGEPVGNYRKAHLFMTDETWALEGPQGFYGDWINGLGQTAIGICMDINPYRFEAPWNAFEFAFHVLEVEANLVILSMAWLTREDAQEFSQTPEEPDMDTLMYWVTRLEPIIRKESKEEIIVVFANRSGVEDDVVYAGTSAVLGIKDGEVRVYGVLGRGDKELLVVDTEDPPYACLVYQPQEEAPKHATSESPLTDPSATSRSEEVREDSRLSTPDRFSAPRTHGSDRHPRSSNASDQQSTGRKTSNHSGSTGYHSSSRHSAERYPGTNAATASRQQQQRQPAAQSRDGKPAQQRRVGQPYESPAAPYAEYQHPMPYRPIAPDTEPALVEQFARDDTLQAFRNYNAFQQDNLLSPPPSTVFSHFSLASPRSPGLLWVPSARARDSRIEAIDEALAEKSASRDYAHTISKVSRYNAAAATAPREFHLQKPPKKTKAPSRPDNGNNSYRRSSPPASRNTSRSRGSGRHARTPDSNVERAGVGQKMGQLPPRILSSQDRSTPEHRRGGSKLSYEDSQPSSSQHERSTSHLLRGRVSDRPSSRNNPSARPPNSLGDDRDSSRGRRPPKTKSSSRQASGTRRHKSSSRQRGTGPTERSHSTSIDHQAEPSPPPVPQLDLRSRRLMTKNKKEQRKKNMSVNELLPSSRSTVTDPVAWHTQQPLQPIAGLEDYERRRHHRNDDNDNYYHHQQRYRSPSRSPSPPPQVMLRSKAKGPYVARAFEPKTPVAMLLLSKGSPAEPAVDPDLKCVDRTTVESMEIPRPRSA